MGLLRDLANFGTLITLEAIVIANTLPNTPVGDLFRQIPIAGSHLPTSGAMYGGNLNDINMYLYAAIGTVGAIICYAIVDQIGYTIGNLLRPEIKGNDLDLTQYSHFRKPPMFTRFFGYMASGEIGKIITDYKQKNNE